MDSTVLINAYSVLCFIADDRDHKQERRLFVNTSL